MGAMDKPIRTPPIDKIEVNGEIISDKEQLATCLVNWWRVWFGEGRKHWSIDENGEPVHPVALDDPRGDVLRQAILDGKFSEVATAGEQLPDYVVFKMGC